jgi:hypothetical protein
MNILFYAKKTTTEGLVPIYMRVTIAGNRFEISSKRYVRIDQWVQWGLPHEGQSGGSKTE